MALNYECVVIMDPALSEESVKSFQDQFSKLITDRGGEVVHVKPWGKRRLMYPIERKREGIYVVFCFRFEQSAKGLVEEFERQVRINDGLLREMTVKVPEFKIDDNPPPEFTFRRDLRPPRSYRGTGPSRPADEHVSPEGQEGEGNGESVATEEAPAVETAAGETAAGEAEPQSGSEGAE
jgi:small subunit ribosomal protein S6